MEIQKKEPSQVLTALVADLSYCQSREELSRLVTQAARQLTGASGATFVFKDEDRCYYFNEDAISPLWKGKKFPATSCISGWAMMHREVVVLRDVFKDPRIPIDAYRPTFVKSLCMVPIREKDPIGAIGTYWAEEYTPTEEEVKLLRILASNSAVALENLELRERVKASPMAKASQALPETLLQSVAHDLKSPLGTLLGFAEVLKEMPAVQSDAAALRYTDGIIRSALRLGRQVDRVLALYRMSNPDLRKERWNLTSVVEELAHDLQARNADREIRITVEPGLWVRADEDLLCIAVENLLANAVKFTQRRPEARIFVGKHAGPRGTEFFVEDNGEGFDPAESFRLFQPMVRLHEDKGYAGTGLGLASVARIVSLHQGSVRAEGRPGEGATFFFSLPEMA